MNDSTDGLPTFVVGYMPKTASGWGIPPGWTESDVQCAIDLFLGDVPKDEPKPRVTSRDGNVITVRFGA